MTGLIEDLLDVSRVTRGNITLDEEALDVRSVISEAVEQVKPAADAHGHYLEVNFPPADVRISGDKKRLVQVFANLLSNAVKYTHNGGHIVFQSEVKAGEVVFAVQDNGIGMSSELAERAFELFVQGERASDRSQGGLGIGLALVKSLVTLHQGSVTAESKGIGLGSKFTITLPLLASEAKDDVQSVTSDIPSVESGLRILLVDDNVDAAEVLGMLLETTGHIVRAEHHPLRALECAETFVPDVCLLDIGLPEMNGVELARRLHQMPFLNGALFIALTGYGQAQDREATQAAGFAHHFVKPVNIPELLDALDNFSKQRSLS